MEFKGKNGKIQKYRMAILTLVTLVIIMIFTNFYTVILLNTSEGTHETQFIAERKSLINERLFRVNVNSVTPSLRFSLVQSSSSNKFGKAMELQIPSGILNHPETIYQTIEFLQKVGRQYIIDSKKPILKDYYYLKVVNHFKRILQFTGEYPDHIWEKTHTWPHRDGLNLQSLGQILGKLRKVQITYAKNSAHGTQLKIELLLDNGLTSLFKPNWYNYVHNTSLLVKPRSTVYAGKDRHYGEVVAFYLNLVLGYHNAPLVVGKTLNLTNEILPYASQSLKNTFSTHSNGTICFYGVCYFCSRNDPICSNEDGSMDGVMILMLKQKFYTMTSPWRRTYILNQFKNWEYNMNFCSVENEDIWNLITRKKKARTLERNVRKREQILLDIVAVSIFDFFASNGDRHDFEILVSSVPATLSHSRNFLLMDNGKSFANPYEDYVDILAPLYQCCKIRRNLYVVLKKFRNVLGQSVYSLLKDDEYFSNYSSYLNDKLHFEALDRRLKIVLAMVQVCLDERTNVIID